MFQKNNIIANFALGFLILSFTFQNVFPKNNNQLFKFDILNAVNSGQATLSASQSDIGNVTNCFDGDTTSLMRTNNINPAFVQVDFTSQRTVSKIRVLLGEPGYPTWDKNDWWVEVADSQADLDSQSGSYQLVVPRRNDVAGNWDEAILAASVSAKIWKFNIERTVGDNYVHIPELELWVEAEIERLVIEPDSLELFENWRWKHNRIFGISAFGERFEMQLSEVNWSTSNTQLATVDQNGNINTFNPGFVVISGEYANLVAEQYVTIISSFSPPVFESIDPFLATPAEGSVYKIPVVVIRFLPTKDGINLDVSYVPDFYSLHEITLSDLIENINFHDTMMKFMLEERSKFRGYKNQTATPYLGYKVVECITVYEPPPPGDPINHINEHPIFLPDYHLIFERFDIEHYVNDLNVKEIWVWIGQLAPSFPSFDPTIHKPEKFRAIWESNMSSPTTGDVSNSNQSNNDLPVFNATYIVYDRNLRRTDLFLHVYGHQLERMLGYANILQDGNSNLFWKKFVGQDDYGNFITRRCGWTHMPPNTLENYDYDNPTLVESDIEDWTPERSGETMLVNVDTWANLNFSYPIDVTNYNGKIEAQWELYWMQNMPGYGNLIRQGDHFLTNWWLFTANWDSAIINNIGLYDDEPADAPDIVSLSIPDTFSYHNQNIIVPITMSSDSAICSGQFVVEFDSNVVEYLDAQIGFDAVGFYISDLDTSLIFELTNTAANKNVLIQINNLESNVLIGNDLRVLTLNFKVKGTGGDSSIIAFDSKHTRVFLTTSFEYQIHKREIEFKDGCIFVSNHLQLSGKVSYNESSRGVPNAEIFFNHSYISTTNDTGFYHLDLIPSDLCTLFVQKSGDFRHAISGSDVVLLLHHLAFLADLAEFQCVAADVNSDGVISGADAIAILRFLAFFTTSTAHTGEWSFIPPDTTFDLTTDTVIDFSGYLLGDVNLDWGESISDEPENLPGIDRLIENDLDLVIGKPIFENQDTVCFPLILQQGSQSVTSLLATIEYDPDILNYETTQKCQLSTKFFMVANPAEQGKIHIALAGAEGIDEAGEILTVIFTYRDFKSPPDLKMTRLIVNDQRIESSTTLIPEKDLTNQPESFSLSQSFPNPFNSQTVIQYQTPKISEINLSIYNSRGQIVRTLVDEKKEPGYFEIIWDGKDQFGNFVSTGLYFVHFSAAKFNQTKKMIYIK